MKIHFLYSMFLILTLTSFESEKGIYLTEEGRVYFKSDAPLEIIEANSSELKGAIDIEKRTFAFQVEIATFEGFNNPLQKEHFNENYLETHEYNKASFLGSIIEKINLKENGAHTIRAKGKLKIHGVTQERIIKSRVQVKDGKLNIQSKFTVLLKEHDIAVPRIVHQKIAEEIQIVVEADFLLSS